MAMEEIAFELIGLVYDAALAPEKWCAFMARFVEALNARSAMLREVDYGTANVGLYETVGFDPAFVAAYREHFVRLDDFTSAFLSMPIGVAFVGEEFVPWKLMRNTEFGNDYIVAQDIRHVMGSVLTRERDRHLQFGLQREAAQGEFGAADRELLRLLAPHMIRAAHIHRQMADVTAEKQWALSALDRLRVGVVLLDERGRPLFANREAERLATLRNGFVIKREGLALSSSADNARLRRLIADSSALASGIGIAGGGCLRTWINGAALQFQVIPLPRGLSERPLEPSLPSGCVAVFVSSGEGPRLPAERIAALHALTRAESRLAALIARGLDPEEAAAALGVSVQTVRCQLKSIYAKTGVRRQAELVALLLSDMLTDQNDLPQEPAT